MNKLSLLAFLLLIFLNSNPQSCLPEGIIFSSQAQIDSFQTIYPGCAKIDGNVIISGPDIINLNELNSLDSIGGDLNINSNDVLVDLAGLEGLTFISEDLRIYSNPELLVLTGLDNLNFIGSDMVIYDNPSLVELSGLEALTSIPGGITIWANLALTSLNGLGNIDSIDGFLQLSALSSLHSLAGLNRVASIGGGLSVEGNIGLTNLTGLDSLTYIKGEIHIYYNSSLTSLAGLDNIDPDSITFLAIYNNISLAVCDVRCVCSYLELPNAAAEIHDNVGGCNSVEEVEAACLETHLEEMTPDGSCIIYPNPSIGKITINTEGANEISLIDQNGMELLHQSITELSTVVDISTMPRGIYFVKIKWEKTLKFGKIVIQ